MFFFMTPLGCYGYIALWTTAATIIYLVCFLHMEPWRASLIVFLEIILFVIIGKFFYQKFIE